MRNPGSAPDDCYDNVLHVNVYLLSCLPLANEVWGKVIFSVAYVKVSVHRGVPGPGGVSEGCRGVLVPGGVPDPRGAWSRGCVETLRWLLLWAVHILLECILVHNCYDMPSHKK